jgi:hypothetical protein
MMFVHDAPLPVDLPETHREPELKINQAAAAQIAARADRGCEGHIRTRRQAMSWKSNCTGFA